MGRYFVLVILLNFTSSGSFAQSEQVRSWLSTLVEVKDSKNISTTVPAKDLIKKGKAILPQLVACFTDTTATTIVSECQGITLTKGEAAIILADRIETMPYALLTGIQNCLMEFCPDNPNFVEYYLTAIRRLGCQEFQGRYMAWLNSSDRKKTLTARRRYPARIYSFCRFFRLRPGLL